MSHSDKKLTSVHEVIFDKNEIPDGSPVPALQSSAEPLSSKLLIKGQGVLIFRVQQPVTESYQAALNLRTSDPNQSLCVGMSANKLKLYGVYGYGNPVLLAEKDTGLVNDEHAFYWVSLDSHNRELWFGTGEARKETLAFSYTFEKSEQRTFLELLETYDFSDNIQPMRLLRDPITDVVPLVVKGMDELTMDAVATNAVLPKANLSTIGQKLYENVAGKNFVLDDKSFPQFSEAIEYSIRTKGCWCYEKIEAKRVKLPAEHKNRVYLRITLGRNSGESPGSPYVLEIWPPASYSAQHSHAGANALIRVLYGDISVLLYPYLAAKKEFGSATFSKDDITWISPTLNQFHMLKNPHANGPTCITIQCYMYDQEDSGHYDFFDYVDDEDKIQQFDPTSDMDFVEFKAKVKEEWDNKKQ